MSPTPAAVGDIPIAIAHPIADLVIGPLRPATILATHSAAVVLCIEPAHDVSRTTPGPVTSDSATRIVSLLTRDASGVPNGARTTLPAAERPFAAIRPGDVAFVGAGQIRIAGMVGRAVRTIRTAVPKITPNEGAVDTLAAAVARADRGVADGPVAEFRAALNSGGPAELRETVRALVGLGTGSTPGGDDVLSGALAGLLATRRDVLAQQIAAAALPDVATRTPLMSADLLRLATLGHVCTEAGAVLRAIHGFDAGNPVSVRELNRTLTALLSLGNTSGADLTAGLVIGLSAAPQPLPRRPRYSRRSSTAARAA